MKAVFIMIMIFAIFIVPIYYGILRYEQRQKRFNALILLKEVTLLRRAGMRETANIIVERAYEK